MKLHTVFITYNRLELTKQAISSYLETVGAPHTYIVIDNCSTDGTKEWLNAFEHPYQSLTRNRYPGFACNQGWLQAPADATHLQRADNDFVFLSGWREEVERMFSENEKVGQIGLRTDEEEVWAKWNVGGNCVIRRELWDRGLRYDERPWTEYPPGFSEDSFFSPAVEQMGFEWDRVERPCIVSLASGDLSDPYYQKSYGDRRIVNPSLYKQQLGAKE